MMQTLAVYNIQKDTASNYHANFEKAASSLYPSVVLEESATQQSGGCQGLETYKYTGKIDKEKCERGDKIKENSLIDLSEVPVFRKACGSNYLGREDICERIPAGVRFDGSKNVNYDAKSYQ